MQVTLSAEAKKGILNQILIQAKDKFVPNAFVDWSGNYGVILKIEFQHTKFVQKGFFRKKEKPEERVIHINCIEIQDIKGNPLVSDLDWGDLKVKSFNKDFDNIAEFIVQELSQYVPQNQLHLVINNPKKIETLQNPSRR